MYQRILVPCDGSDTSNAGLREALALARDQKAAVRLLHVIDESALALDLSAMSAFDAVRTELRRGANQLLERAREQAAKQGLKAETALRETLDRRVAQAIVDDAREWHADLIVMGTHGRHGVSHMILGSDAEMVLRQSPVAVLMVRHGGAGGTASGTPTA